MTVADIRSAFVPGAEDIRRANRLVTWSVAIHIALVMAVGLGVRFYSARTAKSPIMMISLGGSPGVRSTGTNSLGGRQVEQVAPPEKRPEPIKPIPPEPPAPVAVRTQTRAEPIKPTSQTQTRAISAARPPTTGAQITPGSTVAETGIRSTASGLTYGGGGFGGEVDLSTFCCPEYLNRVLALIDQNWRKDMPERGGTTTLRFVIGRDGHIDLRSITVEKSAGNGILDRAAQRALLDANPRLLPLPPEYKEPTLIIHLNFPYTPR